MNPDATLLFVYGTLKRGGENHRHLAAQEFVGEARATPRYRLYELDGYPGMVESPRDGVGVTGEIWKVDDACLRRLDLLEGLAEGLYRRAPVRLDPPYQGLKAETYLYLRPVAGRRDLGATFAVGPIPSAKRPASRPPPEGSGGPK